MVCVLREIAPAVGSRSTTFRRTGLNLNYYFGIFGFSAISPNEVIWSLFVNAPAVGLEPTT